jgi:hypothetical protein
MRHKLQAVTEISCEFVTPQKNWPNYGNFATIGFRAA